MVLSISEISIATTKIHLRLDMNDSSFTDLYRERSISFLCRKRNPGVTFGTSLELSIFILIHSEVEKIDYTVL